MDDSRARWVSIFFLAGAVAMAALLVMALDPLAGLPFAMLSWPVTAVAGYRIWRADHPTASAQAAVLKGADLYGGVAVGAALSVAESDVHGSGGESHGTGDGGTF